MNKVILNIPKKFFSKEFLEIECKKGLGVKGDDLPMHFRGDMQKVHRGNKRSKLFGSDMFYMLSLRGDSVILVGSKA